MQAILDLYSTEEYVYHILSASPGSQGDLEKTDWLDFYFPVPYQNRHFVRYPGENKAGFIEQYCKQNNINIQDCSLLDDTQRHLKEAEEIGVNAVHPAHLICEYEKKQELTNHQDKYIMLIKTIRGNIVK